MDFRCRNPYPCRQSHLDEEVGENTVIEPEPQRKGRDFAIGAVGSILLAISAVAFSVAGGHAAVHNVAFVALAIGGIISLFTPRKFIGIGILCAMVAIPVLFVGSCFGFLLLSL